MRERVRKIHDSAGDGRHADPGAFTRAESKSQDRSTLNLPLRRRKRMSAGRLSAALVIKDRQNAGVFTQPSADTRTPEGEIRTLFQRTKGRDLFALWLAVEEAGVLAKLYAVDCHRRRISRSGMESALM